MQKINYKLADWVNFAASEACLASGDDHIRLSEPATIYAVDDDQRTPLAYGSEFRLIGDASSYSCDVDFAVYNPPNTARMPLGDIFTNESKRPTMSVAEQAVTLALRQLNRKQRELDVQSARLTTELKAEKGQRDAMQKLQDEKDAKAGEGETQGSKPETVVKTSDGETEQ